MSSSPADIAESNRLVTETSYSAKIPLLGTVSGPTAYLCIVRIVHPRFDSTVSRQSCTISSKVILAACLVSNDASRLNPPNSLNKRVCLGTPSVGEFTSNDSSWVPEDIGSGPNDVTVLSSWRTSFSLNILGEDSTNFGDFRSRFSSSIGVMSSRASVGRYSNNTLTLTETP